MLAAAWLASLVMLQPALQEYEAELADGTQVSGSLVALKADRTVTLAHDRAVDVPGSALVRLRQRGVPLPAWPSGPHLLLTNGDRLPGRFVRLDNRFAIVRPAWTNDPTEELRVPLSVLSVVWLDLAAHSLDPHSLEWGEGKRPRDVFFFRNGDRHQGTLVDYDPKAHSLRAKDQETGRLVAYELTRLGALALSTELSRKPRVTDPYWQLVLAGGGRLSVTELRSDGKEFVGKTLFGSTVKLPLNAVVELAVRGGPAVYLSELKPSAYEYTPYQPAAGLSWPLATNRSVSGRPLMLQTARGREVFDRGLGTHSQCRVSYRLDGQYRRFAALVGLHDEAQAGQRGCVQIDVLCDGQSRLAEPLRELTHADGPRAVDIDVTKVNQLTLIVNFGRGADVQDHVDWVDARLIRLPQ